MFYDSFIENMRRLLGDLENEGNEDAQLDILEDIVYFTEEEIERSRKLKLMGGK